MFDKMKNLKELASLMGNMGDMKERMDQMQAELEKKTAQGESGAGAVRVVLNGKFEAQTVTIDPAMVSALAGAGTDTDREMVEELLAGAFNNAVEKVQDMLKDSMSDITGGMGLPGM